jgi:sulfur carrier protein
MEMKPPISILLNGSPHALEKSLPLSSLIESLGLAGKPVVVELDKTAVFPKDYPRIIVGDGACVEVVVLAAGG